MFAPDSADRTVESLPNGEDATVGPWKKDGDTNLSTSKADGGGDDQEEMDPTSISTIESMQFGAV